MRQHTRCWHTTGSENTRHCYDIRQRYSSGEHFRCIPHDIRTLLYEVVRDTGCSDRKCRVCMDWRIAGCYMFCRWNSPSYPCTRVRVLKNSNDNEKFWSREILQLNMKSLGAPTIIVEYSILELILQTNLSWFVKKKCLKISICFLWSFIYIFVCPLIWIISIIVFNAQHGIEVWIILRKNLLGSTSRRHSSCGLPT